MRIDPADHDAVQALLAQLPEGWVMGPTHCPIGIDRHPMVCSAGYCVACQWIHAHWDRQPRVELQKPENE
jgi:hypothetical protein